VRDSIPSNRPTILNLFVARGRHGRHRSNRVHSLEYPNSESAGSKNSESTTAATLSEMFGRGMIYAGIFALQAGAAIVITPLAVRHLSKEEFGRFVTVFTLSQLLITVLGFGLGTAIQRLYSDDSGEFRTTRGLLGFGIVLSLLTTGLVDISGPLWSQILKLGSYGMTLRFGVWAAGLAAIAMLMAQFFRSQDRLWSFAGAMLPLAVGSQ
jgi:hypothetical protein